jgi:putative SOS response-associated peptidase YedK
VLTVRQFEIRTLDLLHWGLIPFRAKNAARAAFLASASAVATSPVFRSAFQKRRCLIIADGFYERLRTNSSKPPILYEVFYERLRTNSSKPPILYEVDGGRAFAIAGIWQHWHNLDTCCIIITDANKLIADVVDSMPVILDSRDCASWLNPQSETSSLKKLLVPFDSSHMSARLVSAFVKDANNQGPQCIAPP